jgi:hypothetical protein
MSQRRISALRELILQAAPDPTQAAPIKTCGEDEPLDGRIPFSSLIVLGVVVAVEDRYGVTITRGMLERAARTGITLRDLDDLLEEVLSKRTPA